MMCSSHGSTDNRRRLSLFSGQRGNEAQIALVDILIALCTHFDRACEKDLHLDVARGLTFPSCGNPSIDTFARLPSLHDGVGIPV